MTDGLIKLAEIQYKSLIRFVTMQSVDNAIVDPVQAIRS